MKRLLLICSLLAAFFTIAPKFAAAQTTQQVFTSHIATYEAGVKRNVPTVAQQSFNAAMSQIASEIAGVNLQIQNTTNPTLIASLTLKLNNMQQIQTDLQGLQSNLVTNYPLIRTKLDDFIPLM